MRLPVPPLRHKFQNATPGFEPGVKDLQSSALPLGYIASLPVVAHLSDEDYFTSYKPYCQLKFSFLFKLKFAVVIYSMRQQVKRAAFILPRPYFYPNSSVKQSIHDMAD